MTEFERVLEECLRDLEKGTSSMEECLSRHPGYAAQLRPILLASTYLGRAREVHVSDEFKARVRARVMQDVRAHPRTSRLAPGATRSAYMIMRLSLGLVAILLAMVVTGTAYAQETLPGNAFYPWKLASENAWRAVSSDPVETDLKIATRRADELIAVSKDPALYSQALETYLETAARLKREVNVANEARILPLLDSQMRRLHQSGITLPLPHENTPPAGEPAATPIATPLLTSPTPQPNMTVLPQVMPTPQALPKTIPTVQAPPPRIVPTLHSPPAIAPTTRSQIP